MDERARRVERRLEGHGDLSPETDAGRVIAMVVMLAAIGFVAILTAAAAERFIANRREPADERRQLGEQLDEILRRLDAMDRERGPRNA